MLGQSHVEKLVDAKLKELGAPVLRSNGISNIEIVDKKPVATFTNGEKIQAKFLIGADGSRSFVREQFQVPFEIVRPQIVWAVIDGIIESDFPKVPEIIVFQADTSDVAWIPREGEIDRFYVRMDTKDFTMEEAVAKINRAMSPHSLRFQEVVWYSQFSVKESVAKSYLIDDCVFLAGDACHVHSVNGGQGLNTGLADAFNLIWKLHMVLKLGASPELLRTYESERKPVAQSVIESSGALVRSTKFSAEGTHAQDYVKLVQKYAGNITGMGIRYGEAGLSGSRLFDLDVRKGNSQTRLYSLLDYSRFTLLLFGDSKPEPNPPGYMNVIQISSDEKKGVYWTQNPQYTGKALLVRPDSYIAAVAPIAEAASLLNWKLHE
jgi:2-polyprenyl-6-methoxyphenol hydroxylase-like FAD-dependent oxidoreductase